MRSVRIRPVPVGFVLQWKGNGRYVLKARSARMLLFRARLFRQAESLVKQNPWSCRVLGQALDTEQRNAKLRLKRLCVP